MGDTEILKSWDNLNTYLRDASVSDCERLLKSEANGKNRLSFLRRVHSRLNKVRADNEREKLEAGGLNGESEGS
nr:MAG TPA: hypothetical protein [Caudoviricetes sp.]